MYYEAFNIKCWILYINSSSLNLSLSVCLSPQASKINQAVVQFDIPLNLSFFLEISAAIWGILWFRIHF